MKKLRGRGEFSLRWLLSDNKGKAPEKCDLDAGAKFAAKYCSANEVDEFSGPDF